jgi:hypothetical protein
MAEGDRKGRGPPPLVEIGLRLAPRTAANGGAEFTLAGLTAVGMSVNAQWVDARLRMDLAGAVYLAR